jgi:AmiR/NasT family two-component response regulator
MERVLLASGSDKGITLLSQLLRESGYNQITNTKSGNDARRCINQTEYELIVINTPLTDEFGHEFSIKAAECSNSGIILICKSDISEDVSVCVVPKPVNKVVFHQSVRLVSATRSRMLGLQNENFKLQTKIEEIRLVNRAKCCLIQYLKFSEPQAHRYIEKQAMDTRQTRKEVAQRILSTYET